MTGLNSPAGPELWTCSHTVGSDYLGYTRNCELGIEALDANGVLLGVFANEDDADNAIFNCWDKKLRSNSGGSDTPSPPKAEGDSFCWFDRLSDEQKDAALDHMLECIAARNSSLLDVQNDNNLIPEIARSGAPHAAEISRRHVQKRNGADFA